MVQTISLLSKGGTSDGVFRTFDRHKPRLTSEHPKTKSLSEELFMVEKRKKEVIRLYPGILTSTFWTKVLPL